MGTDPRINLDLSSSLLAEVISQAWAAEIPPSVMSRYHPSGHHELLQCYHNSGKAFIEEEVGE